jgi:hypothetical protein
MLSKLIEMPHRQAGPPVRMHPFCRQNDAESGELRSADDEHKIAMILDLFDKAMDRFEETARKTSRGLLCWLRSSRPFGVLSETVYVRQLRFHNEKVPASLQTINCLVSFNFDIQSTWRPTISNID